MPQSPLSYNSINAQNALVANKVDNQGALRMTPAPDLTALGITVASVVKAGPGRISRINVVVAGTGAGGVYDCLTTAAAAASNQIASIPPLSTAQLGSLSVEANAKIGITVIPGAGQTLAAIYE